MPLRLVSDSVSLTRLRNGQRTQQSCPDGGELFQPVYFYKWGIKCDAHECTRVCVIGGRSVVKRPWEPNRLQDFTRRAERGQTPGPQHSPDLRGRGEQAGASHILPFHRPVRPAPPRHRDTSRLRPPPLLLLSPRPSGPGLLLVSVPCILSCSPSPRTADAVTPTACQRAGHAPGPCPVAAALAAQTPLRPLPALASGGSRRVSGWFVALLPE